MYTYTNLEAEPPQRRQPYTRIIVEFRAFEKKEAFSTAIINDLAGRKVRPPECSSISQRFSYVEEN